MKLIAIYALLSVTLFACTESSPSLSPEGNAALQRLLKIDYFGNEYWGEPMEPPNSEGYLAFEVLCKERNASNAFAFLTKKGSLPGKFYGLAGLKIFDRAAFDHELPKFLNSEEIVDVVNGCLVGLQYKSKDVAKTLREVDYPQCVYSLEYLDAKPYRQK